MTSTYVNDLRLNEMATGDASGSWGTVTNTNLELIGEALGYGTEAITTNADTHTSTIADGATDPIRAIFIKYTGTLDSACTITIGPNTVNKFCFIHNATSGSQSIIISQGSGANVTIATGQTKGVYLDGAGSGAAVVDAFATLSVVDLLVDDALTVTGVSTFGGGTSISTAGVLSLEAGGSLTTAAGNDLNIVYPDGRSLFFKEAGTTTLTLDNAQGATFAGAALVTGVLTTTAATVFNGGFAANNTVQIDSSGGTSGKGRIQFGNSGQKFIEGLDTGNGGSGSYLKFGSGSTTQLTLDNSGNFNVIGSLDVATNAVIDGTALVTGVLTTTAATVFNGGFASNGNSTVGGTFSVTGANAATVSIIAPTDNATLELRGGNSDSAVEEANIVFYQNNAAKWQLGNSTDNGFKLYNYAQSNYAITIDSTGGAVFTPVAGGHAVFNEGGIDADFRVESDGNANMLFVDAGANVVHIGNTAGYGGNLNVNGSKTVGSGIPVQGVTVVDHTAVAAGVGGAITFSGIYDTNNNITAAGSVEGYKRLATSGHYSFGLKFRSRTNGSTNDERLYMDEVNTVFNETGHDTDFRVESGTNANMLTVDASTNVLGIGKLGSGSTTKGAYFNDSATNFFHFVITHTDTEASHSLMFLNRQSSDGQLIDFRQADSLEGSISVSGSTVTYTGFSGRHESSGIPVNTPVGTVVSTIDALDVYPATQADTDGGVMPSPKAGQTRADHAQVEVSTSEGDSCVYGVVSEFDSNGKLIVTSVGIGSIRVTGACSKGDLLESNGDGTAKVQSDDIMRSKTIGKVTIGNGDTGVKLVSCVMYCG